MQIDETLNVVEMEEAGNTDKSIPLSKPNSPTKSLAIGKAKLSKKLYGDPISFNASWKSFASAVDDSSRKFRVSQIHSEGWIWATLSNH